MRAACTLPQRTTSLCGRTPSELRTLPRCFVLPQARGTKLPDLRQPVYNTLGTPHSQSLRTKTFELVAAASLTTPSGVLPRAYLTHRLGRWIHSYTSAPANASARGRATKMPSTAANIYRPRGATNRSRRTLPRRFALCQSNPYPTGPSWWGRSQPTGPSW